MQWGRRQEIGEPGQLVPRSTFLSVPQPQWSSLLSLGWCCHMCTKALCYQSSSSMTRARNFGFTWKLISWKSGLRNSFNIFRSNQTNLQSAFSLRIFSMQVLLQVQTLPNHCCSHNIASDWPHRISFFLAKLNIDFNKQKYFPNEFIQLV